MCETKEHHGVPGSDRETPSLVPLNLTLPKALSQISRSVLVSLSSPASSTYPPSEVGTMNPFVCALTLILSCGSKSAAALNVSHAAVALADTYYTQRSYDLCRVMTRVRRRGSQYVDQAVPAAREADRLSIDAGGRVADGICGAEDAEFAQSGAEAHLVAAADRAHRRVRLRSAVASRILRLRPGELRHRMRAGAGALNPRLIDYPAGRRTSLWIPFEILFDSIDYLDSLCSQRDSHTVFPTRILALRSRGKHMDAKKIKVLLIRKNQTACSPLLDRLGRSGCECRLVTSNQEVSLHARRSRVRLSARPDQIEHE